MPIPGLPFTDEQLFPLQNAALVAWAVLAIAPRHKLTLPIVTGMTLFYGSLYAALMVASVMEGRQPRPDATCSLCTAANERIVLAFSSCRRPNRRLLF